MDREKIRERILRTGIVPVVRAASAEQARIAAEGVCAGGIDIVEITMTVPGAIKVIEDLSSGGASPLLVGAGTVLDAQSARRCVHAGAQFLVSPGFDYETVRFANGEGILVMVGALTPTEIMAVWKAGADLVKIFPCSQVGGPKYIRALAGPFPQIPFVPTGGVNLENAAEFIKAGAAALGVGGELVHSEALQAGRPELISQTARKFVEILKQARAAAVPTFARRQAID